MEAVNQDLGDGKKNLPFIESCFIFPYREERDDRWFSHFEELPQIDQLRKNGEFDTALELCKKGLVRYPDSFLFYLRACDIYECLNQSGEADDILRLGLKNSLCKSSLCWRLAHQALKRKEHRLAVLWWVRSCVLQLETILLVDFKPFLDLAYVCQPIAPDKVVEWFFEKADQASIQGPVRFNSVGAEVRHEVARSLMMKGDDESQKAILLLFEKYS